MNHLETGNGGKVMERQYNNIVNEIILSQGESQNIKISYGNYKVVEKMIGLGDILMNFIKM